MAQKSIFTEELAELVASNARGDVELVYHVEPHYYGGWAVRKHGARRAVRVFKTEKEATAFGKKYALSKSAAELAIHDKHLMIKKTIRFKNNGVRK